MARRILLAALAVLLVTLSAAQVDVSVGAGDAAWSQIPENKQPHGEPVTQPAVLLAGPVNVGAQVPSGSPGAAASPLAAALATAGASPAPAAPAAAAEANQAPAAPTPAPAPAPAAPAPAAATLRAGLGAGGLLDQLRDQITDVHSRLTAAITGTVSTQTFIIQSTAVVHCCWRITCTVDGACHACVGSCNQPVTRHNMGTWPRPPLLGWIPCIPIPLIGWLAAGRGGGGHPAAPGGHHQEQHQHTGGAARRLRGHPAGVSSRALMVPYQPVACCCGPAGLWANGP